MIRKPAVGELAAFIQAEPTFLLWPDPMVFSDQSDSDGTSEIPDGTGARSATILWSRPRDRARRVAECREAAAFCLEFTSCSSFGPGGVRRDLVAAQAEFLKGRGAPAPRIIGLGGAWGWPWPFPLWVQEQAARYMKMAARTRKKQVACDKVRRRLRKRRWASLL
jgi:hypothetical protein